MNPEVEGILLKDKLMFLMMYAEEKLKRQYQNLDEVDMGLVKSYGLGYVNGVVNERAKTSECNFTIGELANIYTAGMAEMLKSYSKERGKK